jgi:O-antigen/teichoic acid export membrane protein
MSEERTLFRGTAANVVGLAAGVLAVYGVQVLFTRTLPGGGFGILTVAVQVAFVAGAGSRFGMDLSTVRDVAIGTGAGGTAALRSLVDRCAGIAGLVSIGVAVVLAAASPLFGEYATAIAIGAVSIPPAAVANTYLGATRGLKRMGPTLWVYWIGQPVAWMGLAGVAIALGGGTSAAVWTYNASWLL